MKHSSLECTFTTGFSNKGMEWKPEQGTIQAERTEVR